VSSEQPLRSERLPGGVLMLVMHRPAQRNAINPLMLDLMHQAFAEAEEPDGAAQSREPNPQSTRAIVLCSSTPGMFCSGADLAISSAKRARLSDDLYALYRRLIHLRVPVIAALTGPAVGGGAQLALACDLRVADGASWMRFVGPDRGLAVGAWGLPAMIGRGRALDLALSGRRVDAAEALAIGLVDRVADDAVEHAVALAGQLAALEPAAVARTKAIVAGAYPLSAALEAEASGNRGWTGEIPERSPDGRIPPRPPLPA
jgi:enoyl-CoA hydratase/carnithine racemase